MAMVASKIEIEKCVIKEFLPRYNRIKGSDYSLIKMIEEERKPDSIIANSKGEKLGLEVTQYTGFPHTKAGEQKVKECQFEDIMKKKLNHYRNFHFLFYVPSFPTKRKDMEYLCEKLAGEIENSISKGAREAKSDDVVVLFREDSYRTYGPTICFFLSPEGFDSNGIRKIRNDLIKGLYELIKKKVNDAKKYRNEEENILVIYLNAYDSVLVTEEMGEAIKLLRKNLKKEKVSHTLKEIWILDDSVDIYQVY